MAGSSTAPRAEATNGAPRNASIDSGVSALSSTSTPRKNSADSVSNHDIPSIIRAAGSAEAVIEHLLKEKQAQSQQNAQLWRLVDKQRAMILGLNKDLERALKDKEKYRKKVKELQPDLHRPPVPPVPVTSANQQENQQHQQQQQQPQQQQTQKRGEQDTVPNSKAPVSVPPALSIGTRNALVGGAVSSSPVSSVKDSPLHSPVDLTLAPYPITPPADQPTNGPPSAIGELLDPVESMPRPQDHALNNFDHEAEDREADSARKAANATKDLPISLSLPPSRSLPSKPPQVPPPRIPALATAAESKPIDEGFATQFPAPPAPPPRKPPPAPLLLRDARPSPTIPIDDEVLESDSDYDSLLEVTEVTHTDKRGRRRTREEDDREREILAVKEAEIRSLSKKSKKSSSAHSTPKSGKAATAPNELPSSPVVAQAVPMQSSHMPASLDGVLSGSGGGGGGGGDNIVQHSLTAPMLSPGLPVSPRPMGLPRSPLHSPPLSPRMGGVFGLAGAPPLSPRPPRQPIPLPPNTPLQTPSPAPGEPLTLSSPKPLNIVKKTADTTALAVPPSPIVTAPDSRESPTERFRIFRGFVSEEYPDLLLPPNALPSIDIKVASSRMKPSRASLLSLTQLEEDPVFTLAVFSRADGGELWRVEKDSASLAKLDQRLKQCSSFTARTPDRTLFSGHSPAKLDARRQALNAYLDELLNTPLDHATALDLCRYLSTNTLPPNADETGSTSSEARKEKVNNQKPIFGDRPFKNGYLTKRGKNFGGWKARFFVLDGPHLKYYETPGGAHLGTIKLQNAQIGKQSQQNENSSPARGVATAPATDDFDNQYRHAFLILEPKKKDPTALTKHVLCAESDQERDQWVDALLRWIDYRDPEDDDDVAAPAGGRAGTPSSSKDLDPSLGVSDGARATNGAQAKKKMYGQGKKQHQKQQQQQQQQQHAQLSQADSEDNLIGVSYEATQQGELPQGAPSTRQRRMSQDSDMRTMSSQPAYAISAPKDPQIISDSSSWGSRGLLGGGLAPPTVDEKKVRKRSFFGFGTKSRTFSDGPQDSLFGDSNVSSSTSSGQGNGSATGPTRQVFGAPLSEAVFYNSPVDVKVPLPAVVYRCIQYLDGRNAIYEEGIFRLSGSNVIIKQLRERFNNESDINLLEDPTYYDIHAVASLLKMYLRELPTTILTRDLHMQFLAVTEMANQEEKLAAMSKLAQRLPQANATLLKYLVSFLIRIINHSDQNKMTVRNVGIVFSPTLNIPAPVFALLLQNYEAIFGIDAEEYELPSPASDEPQGRRPSLSSMSTGATIDSLPQRPSTSHAGESPHRQRLLDAVKNGGGAGGMRKTQTPPPVLMSSSMSQLQSSRSTSTPTPPPMAQAPSAYSLPTQQQQQQQQQPQQQQQQQRMTTYEPQYFAQQQASAQVTLRPAYESGFVLPPGFDATQKPASVPARNNPGYDRPIYESTNRRESAILPNSPAVNLN
ncbi:rhogap with PH domain protein [Niveomyces insectorum RCEF 264]|uniref:Rhogap with PH domain protein n=1 Tax=Niveomyces insectorum RCEF 264 TaxID=1081102 RepID=A0A167UWP1_9HYPO|nr:rhogap with PH domain protein [Niveomyces insectorum RCEF 264]